MGLFAMSMEDTIEDKLKCCKINIELFETHGNNDMLYLLECFAMSQLEEAIELCKKKIDN